jgi:carbon monoxide dehydrogenase subunit G
VASIRREVALRADPAKVWAALLDLGALPKLAPGVVLNARMEDGVRLVTFANGLQLREWIVDIDPVARRLVMASTGGRIVHLNSSVQIFVEGQQQCRVVWVVDFLPNEISDRVRDIVDREVNAARSVLEQRE